MMTLPEGYDHKATSENFPRTQKVVIYYNRVEDLYLIQVEEEGRIIKSLGTLTAGQLELVIHAGSDVLHDAKV
jgi:hypothetical protein